VLGSSSMKAREEASAALLGYGYNFYETRLVVKGGTALAAARVWKAEATPVDVGIDQDLYLTLPRGGFGGVSSVPDLQPKLIAPLARNAEVGRLRVTDGAQTIATVPLHPLKSVAAGGWWRRLVDSIRLWFA